MVKASVLFAVFFFLSLRVYSMRPLVVTSDRFLRHKPTGYHPECPDRVANCISTIEKMDSCEIRKPSAELSPACESFVLEVIRRGHHPAYVNHIHKLSTKGAPFISPWDQDTYLSPDTFDQCVLAQSAWIDCVNAVVNDRRTAFALTRPPGHHAGTKNGMGFCLFNFAVGAALYATNYLQLERVAILDFDVHFGNGIAEMIAHRSNIRYCSLHEDSLFPLGQGRASERGGHGNILNIPLRSGTKWEAYREQLVTRALPYLQEFKPDLLIVSAGYGTYYLLLIYVLKNKFYINNFVCDCRRVSKRRIVHGKMMSYFLFLVDLLLYDFVAFLCYFKIQLYPKDYGDMASLIKDTFGSAVLFG